jgi:hypothetical protein
MDNKAFNKPKTLFQQQLNEIMTDDPCKNLITDLIHVQMHKNAEKDEKMLVLVELFNMVGLEEFTKIIDLIDGRQIKFPTRDEFRETVETAICYYYRNFQGYDWSKIEDLLADPDMKSVKMGIKVSQLQNFMKERVENLKSEEEKKHGQR